jgi:deoxyribodipyrimidine photo-lyase
MSLVFPPSRAAGLQRLSAFAPYAGRDYAAGRNTDTGPDGHAHVSMLSPYVRHRLISEREVVQAVLAKHTVSAAEKYIQEVLWRTYWKGWLEMRPSVWERFTRERDQMRAHFPNARAIAAAESGMTGIDGFDDWARELVATGYLHNHARMWFASIWIFTLRLPWTLGADFFLRHLIDADAASNTLSWRWVAGLQTAGKTYLATAENIARFTGGRYAPKGLATDAVALTEPPLAPPVMLPKCDAVDDAESDSVLLLVTADDLSPETLFLNRNVIKAATVIAAPDLAWGERSAQFIEGAAAETANRLGTYFRCPVSVSPVLDATMLATAAERAKVRHIVTPYAPVGPVADALQNVQQGLATTNIAFTQVRRSWDNYFWPFAQKGFFPFKEKIASGLVAEGLIST